jgi:queuine tRNA-ribosyltransferase
MLGSQLATIHNLHFYQSLMRGIREAIREGRFTTFRQAFEARYRAGTPAAGQANPDDTEHRP